MALERALELVGKEMAALKAEAMMEPDPEKQRQRLEQIGKMEAILKQETEKEVEELKSLLREAEKIASIFSIKRQEAITLLCLREIRRLHWDYHNTPPAERK